MATKASKRKGKTKPTKGPTETDLWLGGHRAMPRADLETYQTGKSRQRLYRWWIRISLIILPFMVLGYLALLPGFFSAQQGDEGAETTLSATSQMTKQAATTAVLNWLSSDPGPVPGGQIVSWDGITASAESTEVQNGDEVVRVPGYEVHAFTLGSSGKPVFSSKVHVSYDPQLGAQVQGTPSLEPLAPTALTGAPVWQGVQAVGASDSVQQAVGAWADAFTSGDPDRLRLITGDPDPAHAYLPLIHADGYTDLSVGSAAVRGDGLTVVRVAFSPTWSGAPLPADSQAPPSATYDVLVDRADTASPAVVAWGGPGPLDALQVHGNALTGVDLSLLDANQEQVLTQPSPEPTAAPTPEPQG